MANNPKKVTDPTEFALSAIQEALNISDAAADTNRHLMRDEAALSIPPATPTYNETPFDTRASSERSSFDANEQPRPARRAANDDRETIGQILQAIQKGRPARNVYTLATLFAGVWVIGCGLLTVSFLPALQAAIGQGSGGVLVAAGLVTVFFAPVLLFYFLASLAWRGQELRMIAQSMAQVAIRFSEPEGAASDSMVTVGQAIRREVAAMGDGVERAIARAGELETLVANEVAALERAYSDNEVRIRALLQDIAHQRDNLVGQAEQVRSAISGVQIDLRHEQVHDSLKNSSDSLLPELELRSGDLVNKIDEAGNRLASRILTSGDKASDALDVTVNTLVAKVIGQTENAHDSLALQMSAYDELVKNQGGELAEKFARDSGTLGALITRHISEFDRTVKTFGGEIVERMGQRTQEMSDSLKNYVDTFDTRLVSNSGEITASLDQRLLQFETTLSTRVSHLDTSLDSKIRSFDETIDGRLKSLETTFDTRAKSVTETIDDRLNTLSGSLTDGAAQASQSIDQRLTLLTSSLTDGTAQAIA